MHKGHVPGIATSILFAALSVSANAEPMKELAAYKSSLGEWKCDVTELGSGKKFKGVAEKTVEFDGNTYVERYYEIADADHPNAWKAIFIMSYDAQSHRWVRNGVDNSGDRNAASSSGWNGDTWVWENEGVNIVITTKGPNAYVFDVDVKGPDGVKRVAEGNCRK
jgi:hypothetical protein